MKAIYLVESGEVHGGYSIKEPAHSDKEDAIKAAMIEVEVMNAEIREMNNARDCNFDELTKEETAYDNVVVSYTNTTDFVSVFEIQLI